MHSNVTIKNVSWPHFSWATLYNKIHNENDLTKKREKNKTHKQMACTCLNW